jgi:hypothetical protein
MRGDVCDILGVLHKRHLQLRALTGKVLGMQLGHREQQAQVEKCASAQVDPCVRMCLAHLLQVNTTE